MKIPSKSTLSIHLYMYVNGPGMQGGTLCPACRNTADISTSKCWKILLLYDCSRIYCL